MLKMRTKYWQASQMQAHQTNLKKSYTKASIIIDPKGAKENPYLSKATTRNNMIIQIYQDKRWWNILHM